MKPYWEGDGITLYLGDCREVTAWLEADVLVTDPPYGVSWAEQSMNNSGKAKRINAIMGDTDISARDDVLEMWGQRPAVVFGSWRVERPRGTRHRLIWHKGQSLPGFNTAPFYPAEEEIYILGSGFVGGPTPNVLTTHERRSGANGLVAEIGHPTPKPLPLMQKLITQCPPGTIADPFAGSGSTLVAAKLQGRKAIGVELVEKYAEIAARRLDQGVLNFGDTA